MNAAARAVVLKAISEGIEVFGINRGYAGMVEGDIFQLDAKGVDNILSAVVELSFSLLAILSLPNLRVNLKVLSNLKTWNRRCSSYWWRWFLPWCYALD